MVLDSRVHSNVPRARSGLRRCGCVILTIAHPYLHEGIMAQRMSSGAVLQSTGHQVDSLVMVDDVLISCCWFSWVTREEEWIYLTDRQYHPASFQYNHTLYSASGRERENFIGFLQC